MEATGELLLVGLDMEMEVSSERGALGMSRDISASAGRDVLLILDIDE